MNITEKIESILEGPLRAEGYEIVRVRLTGNQRKILQIMIERIDGIDITVDDCEKVSRFTSAIMDVEDPIKSAYMLEVSSPGIDRPLVRAKDFKRFAGHAININLIDPIHNRKKFIAHLESADDQGIRLKAEIGKEQVVFDIPYHSIQNAKLYIDFDNYRIKGKPGDKSNNKA